MNESEAKTKWCPLSRDSNTAGNRTRYGSDGDGPCEDDYTREQAMSFPCIGSACMAWRWSYAPDEAAGNRNGSQGFCGLAGKP